MPGCVLRAYGEAFDVDRFLSSSPFQPCAISRRGRPRTPKSSRPSATSGFNLDVGTCEDQLLSVQVSVAAEFVASNRLELQRLVSWPGVQTVTLDFGWDFPIERVAGQYGYFPPALLADCGAIGIGIEVSVYAVSDESSEPVV